MPYVLFVYCSVYHRVSLIEFVYSHKMRKLLEVWGERQRQRETERDTHTERQRERETERERVVTYQ